MAAVEDRQLALTGRGREQISSGGSQQEAGSQRIGRATKIGGGDRNVVSGRRNRRLGFIVVHGAVAKRHASVIDVILRGEIGLVGGRQQTILADGTAGVGG